MAIEILLSIPFACEKAESRFVGHTIYCKAGSTMSRDALAELRLYLLESPLIFVVDYEVGAQRGIGSLEEFGITAYPFLQIVAYVKAETHLWMLHKCLCGHCGRAVNSSYHITDTLEDRVYCNTLCFGAHLEETEES